jgi:hypothetical protein
MKLKQRLQELNLLEDSIGTSPAFLLDNIVREVIAPEVFTHMISRDLALDYDDALEVLFNPHAMFYGLLLQSDESLLLDLGGTAGTDAQEARRRGKRVRRSGRGQ